jgi:hypothetical protein
MRRTPALLTLVLLTLSVVWGAGPAAAGGPTSVLLSVPGEGRVAALYHTEAAYQALDELAGELDAGADASPGERPRAGDGDVVTLTWLIHDVQVWRVDLVHLGGTGAPWVESRQVTDGRSVQDAPASWHRANPKLPQLIDEVLESPRAATLVELGPGPHEAKGAAAPARPSSSTQGRERWSLLALAASTGVGVLAGGALTLVALRRRLRSEPGRTEAPVAATDQLAWP